ncbi:MAG: hypothetical protein U0795_17785 [Pirellulales bacterium]
MRTALWWCGWVLTCLLASMDASAVELVWSDATGIQRISAGQSQPLKIFESFETRGIAFVPDARQIVWSDNLPLGSPLPGGVIRTGSHHGGLITPLVQDLVNPAAVAVDVERGQVYWSVLGDEAHPSAIVGANLDGSNAKTLISGEWLSEVHGLAVDPIGKQLFFSFVNPMIDSLRPGAIAKAQLDGSGVQVIVSGLFQPMGVAVDPIRQEVFWAHQTTLSPKAGGSIEAADFRGQGVHVLLGGLVEPYGVALDPSTNYIYWTDRATGKIQRTISSGALPFFEDVVTDLKSPMAIAVVPEPSSVCLAATLFALCWPLWRKRR